MTSMRDDWRVNGHRHRQPANHLEARKIIGGLSVPHTAQPPRVSDGRHAWRVIGAVDLVALHDAAEARTVVRRTPRRLAKHTRVRSRARYRRFTGTCSRGPSGRV